MKSERRVKLHGRCWLETRRTRETIVLSCFPSHEKFAFGLKKVYRGLNSVIIHPTHPIIPSINYNINHRMSWRFARCAFDETSRFRSIRLLLTRRIAWKCRAHVFGAYSVTNFWPSGSVTEKVSTNVLGFLIPSMTHECIKINMLVVGWLKINISRHSFAASNCSICIFRVNKERNEMKNCWQRAQTCLLIEIF